MHQQLVKQVAKRLSSKAVLACNAAGEAIGAFLAALLLLVALVCLAMGSSLLWVLHCLNQPGVSAVPGEPLTMRDIERRKDAAPVG